MQTAYFMSSSQRLLERRTVRMGTAAYPYYFGHDCLDLIAREIHGLAADRLVVVTDDQVMDLHGDAFLRAVGTGTPITVLSHPPGESMKTMECLGRHLDHALRAGVTKRSVVVSFGGGVPGNLAGVTAGLALRGVRLVHVPTTTVAAMDSTLSLKQTINSELGKNQIGIYYAPTAIFADIGLFSTLPQRELRSGLCEMAKNCLAIVPSTIPMLKAMTAMDDLTSVESLIWLLDASLAAKSSVTEFDEREQKAGLILEYGHTVGHAIELLDHRRRGRDGLTHGEAIAIGMLVAAQISRDRGWLSAEEVDVHRDVVLGVGVRPTLPDHLDVDQIVAVVKDDNKRGYLASDQRTTPFVLLRQLGQPAMTRELPLVSVGFDEIARAVASISAPDPGGLLVPSEQ